MTRGIDQVGNVGTTLPLVSLPRRVPRLEPRNCGNCGGSRGSSARSFATSSLTEALDRGPRGAQWPAKKSSPTSTSDCSRTAKGALVRQCTAHQNFTSKAIKVRDLCLALTARQVSHCAARLRLICRTKLHEPRSSRRSATTPSSPTAWAPRSLSTPITVVTSSRRRGVGDP